jgi:hypothetical protein
LLESSHWIFLNLPWSSHLWLNKVISRFDIHSFIIDIMARISIRIDRKELELILLGLLLVLKLHLDESEASAPSSSSISHNDSISDDSK